MKFNNIKGKKRFSLIIVPMVFFMIINFGLLSLKISAENSVELEFNNPQTAGISGFRQMWDTPVKLSENGKTELAYGEGVSDKFGTAINAIWNVDKRSGGTIDGALVFDAVHRSLLVKFPGFAEQVAQKIGEGYTIRRVTLELPFKSTELWPENYNTPAGLSFIGESWKNSTPNWHAQAYLLRKPWENSATYGPTYNANVNGIDNWAKYGAQDTQKDRFPNKFGSAECSKREPSGEIDITNALTSNAYGETLAQRLKQVEQNGFIVNKEELYDIALWNGGYEWNVARGPQGILIKTPILRVIMVPAAAQTVDVSGYEFNLTNYRNDVTAKGTGSAKTAVMPTDEQINALIAKFGFSKPANMEDWKWQRLQELNNIKNSNLGFPETKQAYLTWLDQMIGLAPRAWTGHTVNEYLNTYYSFNEALPEPVKDHWKKYFEAWLMPWLKTDQYPKGYSGYSGSQTTIDYYNETQDWRGNASVYRTYVRYMGTMNFNHAGTSAVLLGGAMLNNQMLVDEGRKGLEDFPLKTWSWYDGTTQESIDHYYLAISLKSQKIFADYGPTMYDRLIGKSMLDKSIEELADTYHPMMKRFISPSTRTSVSYLIATQDGLQGILHTLSKKGTYTDKGQTSMAAKNAESVEILGHDFDPGMVVQQTLNGSWAPDWMSDIVDNKQLPQYSIFNYKKWGTYASTPLYKTSYLGNYYGISALDMSVGETIPMMSQWVRDSKEATTFTEIGTMLMRPGINRTEFIDTTYHGSTTSNKNGIIGTQGSQLSNFQYKNKIISLYSPYNKFVSPEGGYKIPTDVTSVQGTVALYNFESNPQWEIYVDDTLVESLPYKVKQGQKITIKDGISYLGIIPLPSTNLGRDEEVVIEDNSAAALTTAQNGVKLREAIRINSYLLKQNTPINNDTADWYKIDKAYGGFVFEMGDEVDSGSFDSFKTRINNSTFSINQNANSNFIDIKYQSGNDKMECGFNPLYPQNADIAQPTNELFSYRTINGQNPYLAQGIERDTSISQQGSTGLLQKNGATLRGESGKMMYLLSNTASNTVVASNPLTEPVLFSLKLQGGKTISANGLCGIANVAYEGNNNKVDIKYGVKPGQVMSLMANAFYLEGFNDNTAVTLNGKPVNKIKLPTLNGQQRFAVQLDPAIAVNKNVIIDTLWSQISDVKISFDSSEVRVGEKLPIKFSCTYRDGTPFNIDNATKIEYISSNSDVLTGDSKFAVGKSVGNATFAVKVTYGAVSVVSNTVDLVVTDAKSKTKLLVKTNVALGKPATMSAEVGWGHGAFKAFDGNLNNYCQSLKRVPYNLDVDLGKVFKISEVVCVEGFNSYFKTYDILVSLDNATWKKVAGTTNGRGKTAVFAIPETEARYVRISGTNDIVNMGAWGALWHEIRVFEKRYVNIDELPPGYTDNNETNGNNGNNGTSSNGGAYVDNNNYAGFGEDKAIGIKNPITKQPVKKMVEKLFPWTTFIFVLIFILGNIILFTGRFLRKRKRALVENAEQV